jgi:hypothetical protein
MKPVWMAVMIVLVGAILVVIVGRRAAEGNPIIDWWGRRDSLAIATLERQRDSLDARVRVADSAMAAQRAAHDSAIRVARSRFANAERRTALAYKRADSLGLALYAAEEDDDSLPILVGLVAAKDSVITGLMGERDAARGMVVILERAVASRDTALIMYRSALAEAMRQRDAYRGARKWLKAAGVALVTVGVCRAVQEPC